MENNTRNYNLLSILNLILIATTLMSLWKRMFSFPNIFLLKRNHENSLYNIQMQNLIDSHSKNSIIPPLIIAIINLILIILLLYFYVKNFKQIQHRVVPNYKPYLLFIIWRIGQFLLSVSGVFSVSYPTKSIQDSITFGLFFLYFKPLVTSIIIPSLILVVIGIIKASERKMDGAANIDQ